MKHMTKGLETTVKLRRRRQRPRGLTTWASRELARAARYTLARPAAGRAPPGARGNPDAERAGCRREVWNPPEVLALLAGQPACDSTRARPRQRALASAQRPRWYGTQKALLQ